MSTIMTLREFIGTRSTSSVFHKKGVAEVIQSIATAVKLIADRISDAEIYDDHGSAGRTNVSGDKVQELDIFANDTLVDRLEKSGYTMIIASEEAENPIITDNVPAGPGYAVVFDPLDGSSNINANTSVGTIFSIMEVENFGKPLSDADLLRPGREIITAGYAVFGPSVTLVLAEEGAAALFTLDRKDSEFKGGRIIPRHGTSKIYSINEANSMKWDDGDTHWIEHLKSGASGKYTARYIGSLVADFHRGIIKGGIFAYPAGKDAPKGKLRLLYECAPLAFVAAQTGGTAMNGIHSILDITPTSLHDRSPLYIGSSEEVELCMRIRKEA